MKQDQLAAKKVAELQVIASELGVAPKGLKKAQLIDAILAQPKSAPAKTPSEVSTNGSAPAPEAPKVEASTTQATPPAPTEHKPQFTPRPDGAPREQRPDRDRSRRRRRGRGDRDRGPSQTQTQDRGRGPAQTQDRGPEREQFDRPRVDEPINEAELDAAQGVLDILPEGYGFLRVSGYLPGPEDVYVSLSQVRRYKLRRGDFLAGMARRPKESEKYRAMVRIETVGGKLPEEVEDRPWFEKLTPLYPEDRIRLEVEEEPNQITQRIIDLVAPIGKGQRGMIVSPPKAGKTTVMKQIANSIRHNAPDCHLIVLLVDERPEEVTDMQRSVDGEIIYSTFDRPSDDHIQVTELTLDRAKRMVELGQDVVILLDGITRLSRAYNLATPASGRILSGGVDATALYPPKRFFGAARNIEQGGSLTIIATALVDTGSRMDEVIFEEFKGTGNWELRLDRRAAEKRLFPAIDVDASGTRKEELLLTKDELSLVWKLRRVLHALEGVAGLELLIDKMRQTKSNLHFLMDVGKQNTGD
ncbi:MAG: transcription termination factor Rho [Actinomycetota bacterium]